MEGGQSQQQSNDWKIGSSVALETALGERVEGVVYAFDRVMNCVILQDAPMNPTQKKTYRIINANFIKKKGPGPALPASTMDVRPVRPLDMGRIRAKEASAVADARKDAARINTNVSTDAQKIFNALAKTFAPPLNHSQSVTRDPNSSAAGELFSHFFISYFCFDVDGAVSRLPCRWENETIVIFDDLRISSPYRVEDVRGGAMTSKHELERVKRVVPAPCTRPPLCPLFPCACCMCLVWVHSSSLYCHCEHVGTCSHLSLSARYEGGCSMTNTIALLQLVVFPPVGRGEAATWSVKVES
jgi:small nuclear ribonucleoprotein (snRNP)-like protein